MGDCEATIARLEALARADLMAAPLDSVWPEPRETPAELYEYASDQYGRNSQLRRLLAEYFLRYDALLLERGLISIQAARRSLIILMLEQESRFSGYNGENISVAAMREHIATHREWFAADQLLDSQLSANQAAFNVLKRSWRTDRN